MIDIVKRFFSAGSRGGEDPTAQRSEHDIRVATCALFVEMAKIDDAFTGDEMDAVLGILKDRYDLSKEHADALMAAADQELAQSVDLWRFAELINKHYSNAEKTEILELLWQIVYVDNKLDAHEDYLMHRVGDLLRLTHKDLIDAKLKVLHADT